LNIHFKRLDKSGVFELLIRSIAAKEGVKLTDGGFNALKEYARGDAGIALTILEAAATVTLKRSASRPAKPSKGLVDARNIEEAAKQVFFQRKKAEELIDLVFARRYTDIRARLEVLLGEEWRGGKEILAGIHEALRGRMKSARRNDEANRFARLFVAEGETDLKLCNSLNSMIHLEEMLMRMAMVVEF